MLRHFEKQHMLKFEKNNCFSHTRELKTVENCTVFIELGIIWVANAIHITESELSDRFYSLESIPNTTVHQSLVYIFWVGKKPESCVSCPNYPVLAYWNTQVRSTAL